MKRYSSLIGLVILIFVILFLAMKPPDVKVITETQTEKVFVPVVQEPQRVSRSPEYRPPPYKTYKPPNYQQMGLLLGSQGQTLPLWGKHSYGYNDRYNYYTTTSGEQIYPLPIYHQNRDCTEDIGCQEFYGGEQVEVLTREGETFNVKMYRNSMFYS